jgi:hypothetical protein
MRSVTFPSAIGLTENAGLLRNLVGNERIALENDFEDFRSVARR